MRFRDGARGGADAGGHVRGALISPTDAICTDRTPVSRVSKRNHDVRLLDDRLKVSSEALETETRLFGELTDATAFRRRVLGEQRVTQDEAGRT